MYAIYIYMILTLARLSITAGAKSVEPQTCSSPPVVLNSTISPDKRFYPLGTIISYSCDIGFITEGRLNTAECYLDETSKKPKWTEPNIMCIPRTCGDPGNVRNAHRIGSLFIFPHNVEYVCNEGYKLIGRNKRYCQPAGTWTGRLPSCEIISCPPPKNIRHGQALYNSVEYGSTLEYKCNDGYRLEGISHSECRSNGTWSEAPPNCVVIKCPLPQKPQDGDMTISSESLTVNTVIMFSCDPGRNLIGSRTSKCLESGQWTFDTPKCYLPCEIPTLNHGHLGILVRKYKWRQFKYVYQFKKVEPNVLLEEGESVILRCDYNYEPVGEDIKEASITCSESLLTPVPFCHPAKCRIAPPSPRNGALVSYESETNSTPVYQCNADFKKIYNGSMVCNFGTWKGSTPVCRSTLCPASALANLGFNFDYQQIYKSGESFDVKCKMGYEPITNINQTITCIDGSWKMSNSRLCKPLKCLADPPTSPNLKEIYNSTDHGSLVRYECETGYRVNSAHTPVICEFGQWKGSPPTCKETRCHISSLRFSERILDMGPTEHNKRLNVNCKKDFIPVIKSLKCVDGRFSQAKPIAPCVPDTSSSSSGVHTTKDWSNPITSTVSSHLPINKATSVVVKSSTAVPVFTESSVFTSTTSGITSFSGENATNKNDTAVDYKGYSRPNINYVFKNESLQIPHTTESLPMEACSIHVGDKELLVFFKDYQVDFGTEIPHGSTVKFQCKRIGAYRLTGAKEAVCENGIWKPSFPLCRLPSKKSIIIHYGTAPINAAKITSSGLLHIIPGTTVYLYCNLFDDAKFARWLVTPDRNTALEYTSGNKKIPYAKVIIVNATKENSKEYTCISPYQQSHTITITVRELECPEIPLSLHLSVTYEPNREHKAIAKFKCTSLWQLEGSSNITCLSGKWSALPPQCRYNQCPLVVASGNVSVQYVPNRHAGGTATFHCPPLMYLDGPANITCLPSGIWSSSPPSCEMIQCKLDKLVESLPDLVVIEWNDESMSVLVGTQLDLLCDGDNYVIRGDKTTNCSSTGEWIVGKPYCSQGCGPLRKASNSTLVISDQKEYYKFGEQVVFSCPKGQQLTRTTQRVICLSYGWSDKTVPNCVVA